MATDPFAGFQQGLSALEKSYGDKFTRERQARADALNERAANQAFEARQFELGQVREGAQNRKALADFYGGLEDSPLSRSARYRKTADKAAGMGMFDAAKGFEDISDRIGERESQLIVEAGRRKRMFGPEATKRWAAAQGASPQEIEMVDMLDTSPSGEVILEMPNGQQIVAVTDPVANKTQMFMGSAPSASQQEQWSDPFLTTVGDKEVLVARNLVTGETKQVSAGAAAGADGQEKPLQTSVGLVNLQAKGMEERKEDALITVASLNNMTEAERLLDAGMFSGAGADLLSSFNSFLSNRLGYDLYRDPAANTKAYAGTVGVQVGQVIRLFGSGTGLSDADRKYAANIVGGDVNLDEKALRKLMAINKRAAKAKLRKYQVDAKRFDERLADPNQVGVASAVNYELDRPIQDPNLILPDGRIDINRLEAGDIVDGHEFRGWAFMMDYDGLTNKKEAVLDPRMWDELGKDRSSR